MRTTLLISLAILAGCSGGDPVNTEKAPFTEGLYLEYGFVPDGRVRLTFTKEGDDFRVKSIDADSDELGSTIVNAYGMTGEGQLLRLSDVMGSGPLVPVWIPSTARTSGATAWTFTKKVVEGVLGTESEQVAEVKVTDVRDEQGRQVAASMYEHKTAVMAQNFNIRTQHVVKTGFLVKYEYRTFLGAGSESLSLVETNAAGY